MKRKSVLVIAVIALAVGFVLVPSLLAGLTASKPAGGAEFPGAQGIKDVGASEAVFTVRTEDAEIRSLQSYIEVNGDIVSAEQVTVVPETGGKLVSMRVALGSPVQKGALVAQVDPSRPGSQYSLSPVYAPVSGVVVSSPVPAGSTVTAATPLFTIGTLGSLEIEAHIPEREVGQLRTGLRAEARFEAFPGEVFAAEVAMLSPVVDPASRTKKIVLRLLDNDSRVNPGMFARIKLNTRVYENVVSVPREAVVETRGKTAVFVLAADGGASRVRMREVETGASVDGELEIRDGVAAGEKIVVQGQQFLSDGAAVRVLGNKS